MIMQMILSRTISRIRLSKKTNDEKQLIKKKIEDQVKNVKPQLKEASTIIDLRYFAYFTSYNRHCVN